MGRGPYFFQVGVQHRQAEHFNDELLQSRWPLIQQEQGAVPPSLLAVLLFWLTLLFVSFGLFAPRNATVIIVLLLCTLSLGGAIFLIAEMSRPLESIIKVPSAPMRKALQQLGP